MAERRRRWDVDERRIGIGDARAFRPTVGLLAELVEEEGWVAEQPEAHLLPHLERAADTQQLRIVQTSTDDAGRFLVDFAWTGPGEPDPRELRIALFSLVATVAEEVTVIREPDGIRGGVLEVVTGMTGRDASRFAAHGHTLGLRLVEPPSLRPQTPPG
jgi:hypothetical protein